MPRLADWLFRSVVFLYSSESEAAAGDGPGASGFVVHDNDQAFLITATHVKARCAVVRTFDGKVLLPDWHPHPAGLDVSAARVDSADVSVEGADRALFIQTSDFEIPRPKDSDIEPRLWPFGAGDEAFMIGRHLGLDGFPIPVARFGALMNAAPVEVEHKHLGNQPSFLVEARSRNGCSGSPVFLYRHKANFFGTHMPVEKPRLLGLDWGHLSKAGAGTTAEDYNETSESTSGVMVVIPAWHIGVLLDDLKSN